MKSRYFCCEAKSRSFEQSIEGTQVADEIMRSGYYSIVISLCNLIVIGFDVVMPVFDGKLLIMVKWHLFGFIILIHFILFVTERVTHFPCPARVLSRIDQ